MTAELKAVRGGKQEAEATVKVVKLRGVEYTIREIDTDEYDAIIKQVADEQGNVRFDRLLRAMVAKCVRPLGSKPLSFPIYRTLEGIVNDMHYATVPDENETEDAIEGETVETVPNP